jgi:predicted NBD/HSP70 family sugar kinase
MLAPGSGLGAAYVDANGLPLDGDTLAGMEAGHMPAPLHLLGNIRPFRCGCGRDWGCVETYTTISGLPQLLEEFLPKFPGHELETSQDPIKAKVLSLRGRAQKGDPLALAMFDFQARALGLHVANLVVAMDPAIVVIGGGLIDPESTTPEFRQRYLGGIRKAAEPYLFPVQRRQLHIVAASLGELSQAIGAALVSLYSSQKS